MCKRWFRVNFRMFCLVCVALFGWISAVFLQADEGDKPAVRKEGEKPIIKDGPVKAKPGDLPKEGDRPKDGEKRKEGDKPKDNPEKRKEGDKAPEVRKEGDKPKEGSVSKEGEKRKEGDKPKEGSASKEGDKRKEGDASPEGARAKSSNVTADIVKVGGNLVVLSYRNEKGEKTESYTLAPNAKITLQTAENDVVKGEGGNEKLIPRVKTGTAQDVKGGQRAVVSVTEDKKIMRLVVLRADVREGNKPRSEKEK